MDADSGSVMLEKCKSGKGAFSSISAGGAVVMREANMSLLKMFQVYHLCRRREDTSLFVFSVIW